MFQLPLSSEIAGLTNFLVCEILVMAYVMYVSSIIAGSLNYQRISKGSELQLRVFDCPHIGGGLVMNRSKSRTTLILLRLSTLVAIATSNFGLEGRTITVTKFEEAVVRRPGRLGELNSTTRVALFNATERRMRCAQTVGDELVFGSVMNGVCYPKYNNDVHVKSIGLTFETFTTTATNCSLYTEEVRGFTIFRCRNIDLTCVGRFYGHAGEKIEGGRCSSVIYDGPYAWLCPFRSVTPGSTNSTSCRRMRALQEDIRLWPELFIYTTNDLETAVFGAAYGVEERKFMSVPKGDKNVTIVTLWWFIPAVYQITVLWVVTLWAAVLAWRGARNVAHDEKGLALLLQRRVDMGMVRMADWLPHNESWSLSRVEEPSMIDTV